MSRTTHHFDWKRLEEKPDNWETLRHLIGLCNTIDDVYNDKTELQASSWSALYMDIFRARMLSRYGKDVARCFPETTAPATKKQEKKNNNKKKGTNNIRERVHRETEIKIIEKDMDGIRFDPKTFKPVSTSFRLQPTFAFMIAEWNILLWKRTRVVKISTKPGLLLNAMISMDRIVREDIEPGRGIIDSSIVEFLVHLNGMVQDLLPREKALHSLFTTHPELMVSPFSQKRAGTIALYPEQIKLMDHVIGSVMTNDAMLLGDRMPPGTGKTFFAIPLAQKLAAIKSQKTLLFACHNTLVRTDVATLALLGKNLHLWMGRYDAITGEALIRPHKSCFPSTWKKVYKTQDDSKKGTVYTQCLFYKKETTRFPDILVADLETCLLLLKTPELNDQFVAYIDEFVSEPDANTVMMEIARYLPRQTVLLSAILPRFEDTPSLVEYFRARHEDARIVRIESNHLTISCTVVSPDGRVALPHHFIETVDQIPSLIRRIHEDPLIGRMYAPQQVYQMVVSTIGEELRGTPLSFDTWFPTISQINHAQIREYVLELLRSLTPVQFDKIKSYRPVIMASPAIERIATDDSHFYPGKTLVITPSDTLFPILENIRSVLHAGAPDLDAEAERLSKRRKELTKALEQAREASAKPQQKIDPVEQRLLMTRIEDELASLERVDWPTEFVVNSVAHARRFDHPTPPVPSLCPVLPKEFEDAFPNFLYSLLLSGIGVYDFSQCTEHQRRLVMRVVRQLSFLFAGREIVFGTNIEGLTHLFIDGRFGDHVSRNVLFQLIGRAGRIGQSYQALIVLDSDQTLRSIMQFEDAIDEDAASFEEFFRPLLTTS